MICDAAEALGSRFGGRRLGSFGLCGCFSFSANKTITAGQGGMIATDSDALHDRLRELKDQGRRKGGTGGDDHHPVLGFNFKFTDLQAAVALPQFDEIDDRLAAAVRRDKAYVERLANQPGLSLPPYSEAGEVRQWTDVLFEIAPPFVPRSTPPRSGIAPFGIRCIAKRYTRPTTTTSRTASIFPAAVSGSPRVST